MNILQINFLTFIVHTDSHVLNQEGCEDCHYFLAIFVCIKGIVPSKIVIIYTPHVVPTSFLLWNTKVILFYFSLLYFLFFSFIFIWFRFKFFWTL